MASSCKTSGKKSPRLCGTSAMSHQASAYSPTWLHLSLHSQRRRRPGLKVLVIVIKLLSLAGRTCELPLAGSLSSKECCPLEASSCAHLLLTFGWSLCRRRNKSCCVSSLPCRCLASCGLHRRTYVSTLAGRLLSST